MSVAAMSSVSAPAATPETGAQLLESLAAGWAQLIPELCRFRQLPL